MATFNRLLTYVSALVQAYFLWLLLGCYAAAAFFPGVGLAIRDVSFGQIGLRQQETPITLPMLMLALLLFNAGLGVRSSELKRLPRVALVLLTGLAANVFIPVAFLFGTTPLLGLWLDTEEVQSTLTGFALVAAMPIAGSSTAWSQNVDGNMTLSVGLVVLSTLLSPLTTPIALALLGFLASGDNAEHLRRMATHGTQIFLMVCVVVPAVVGGLLGWAAGEERLTSAKPYLRLLNWAILLLLIYSNASTSLPLAIAYPDLDFLFTTLGIAVVLCFIAFGSGWALAALLGVDAPQRTSLMFGLGMNNNGTGLVLASVAMANHPRVMLPIIIYNLVQHLVAGAVAFFVGRASAAPRTPGITRALAQARVHS